MNGVEFDNERQAILQKMQALQGGEASSSKFVQFLMKHGIVKNEQGGKMVLLGIVALNFIATIILVLYFV